ncbi:MAG: hypothetical protein WAU07_02775 [Microgenomates group bacterium]
MPEQTFATSHTRIKEPQLPTLGRREFLKRFVILLSTHTGIVASLTNVFRGKYNHKRDNGINSKADKVTATTASGSEDEILDDEISDDEISDILTDNSIEEADAALLSQKEKIQLSSIFTYRKKIGLKGLPVYFDLSKLLSQDVLLSNNKMEPSISNSSKTVRSYRIWAEKMAREVFGARAWNIINGFYTDRINQGTHYSNNGVHIPTKIHEYYPQLYNATGLFLHEMIGHAADTEALFNEDRLLPKSTIIAVEYGKWKMLSQAFNVRGEFFNHRGDLMMPKIKLATAREFAKALKIEKINPSLLILDSHKRKNVLDALLKKTGKQRLEDIVFNRHVCTLLGDILFEQCNPRESIVLSERLMEIYTSALDSALVEIYAEMMRTTLEPNPDRLKSNNFMSIRENNLISDGVKTIIEAYRGEKVNLERIRNKLKHPPLKLLILHKQEHFLYYAPTLSNRFDSDSEVELSEQDQFEQEVPVVENVRSLYEDVERFYKEGKVPENQYSGEKIEHITQFSQLVHSVVSIRDFSGLQSQAKEFDHDDYDIWMLDKLFDLFNPRVIENLVAGIRNNESIDDLFTNNRIDYRIQGITEFITGTGYFVGYPNIQYKIARSNVEFAGDSSNRQ